MQNGNAKKCVILDYDSYIKRKNYSPDTVISELCPHCESEVVLDQVFKNPRVSKLWEGNKAVFNVRNGTG